MRSPATCTRRTAAQRSWCCPHAEAARGSVAEVVGEPLDECRAPEHEAEAAARAAPIEREAATARLRHQDLRRRRVPDVQRGVDHRRHAAVQHLAVAERVGVAAQQRELRAHALEAAARAETVELERVAVRDDRARRVALLRHAHGLAVPLHARAPEAEIALVERGHVDQSEHRLAAVDQRDERGEERDAARERDRAVDRIEHPAALDVAFLTVLLAEDAERGIEGAQHLAHGALRGEVGLRDRRAVRLALGAYAPEARQDLATCRVRGRRSGLRRGLEVEPRGARRRGLGHLGKMAAPALHVEVHGPAAGPARHTLVLAHGFGGSARNWRPQLRTLRDRARVVVYDARGHARSEAPKDPAAYRMSELTQDLWRAAEAGDDSRPVLGGLSLGAAVALRAALARPGRARALVLASHPAGPGSGHGVAARAGAFADAIEQDGLEAAGERFAWGPGSGLDPAGAALVRQGFLEHPPHALAHTLRETLAELEPVEALAAR